MNTIQDIISPGSRQAGDAAQSSADAQKMLAERMIKFQDMLLGKVKLAESQGMFDPSMAVQNFSRDFDKNHAQDLNILNSGLARSGLKPGDSEYGYNYDKGKTLLMKEKAQGMGQARQDALMRELAAYSATDPTLNANAASLFNNAGQMGIQAGQIQGQGMSNAYNGIAGLYGSLSKFLHKDKKDSFDTNPWL